MFSELGTIVFYRHYDKFQEIINRLNVKEQSLCISDEAFIQFHGYDRQQLFHVLFQENDMWGFVCGKIKGRASYKILNSNNKVNKIDSNDIYFALKMDGFSYSHWAEMENDKNILHSPHGTPIMKKPSQTTIKKATHLKKVFGLGKNMLYQIVTIEDGKPSYPASNPFNSQWEDYNPYIPSENAFEKWQDNYKRQRQTYASNHPMHPRDTHNTPWASSQKPYHLRSNLPTLHAVPFNRDNIKPTTFTVKKLIKSYENDLRMFINFPNGIPITLP